MGSDSGAEHRPELSDYHKSTLNSLTDVFSDRLEQTLGGATIGVARDLVSEAPTQMEALQRAKENDTANLIVADTVAIIPKFNSLTAGVTRATLLVNPHASVAENAGSFTLNMAEGAALNKVGKMMLPGSSVQAALARNVANPLAREIATHLTVGGGFGAVKTGFNPSNWVDENGKFAPGSLATKMVTGTTAGALLNVPAGMVGMRVMHGSMSLLAERQISQRVATTLAGAGSGYTSGALMGGIDAVSHGKSFSETLDEMHFAGKVGMLTGGVLGASDNGKLTSQYRQIVEGVKRANTVSLQEKTVSPASEQLEPSRPIRRQTQEEIILEERAAVQERQGRTSLDKMDFVPRDYRVADITGRLKNPQVQTEALRVLKPGSTKIIFDSFSDFLKHTDPVEVKMRVYEVEGHSARLAIEESLALKMDQTRNDRIALEYMAKREVPYDKLSAGDRRMISLEWSQTKDHEGLLARYMSPEDAKASLTAVKARMHLVQNGAKNGPVAEDFVALMDESPNRSKISRVDILHRKNPEDPWTAQQFNDPTFASAASASRDGRITFYMPEGTRHSIGTLRTFMNHEFGHVAANNTPDETAIYGLAAHVDKDIPNPNYRPEVVTTGGADSKLPVNTISGENLSTPLKGGKEQATTKYYAREYAKKNLDEDGAVHMGEEMLHQSSTNLRILGEQAPVRTVVLSKSLMKVMLQAQGRDQSVNADKIWNRIRFVEKEVYPEAIKLLEKRLKTGDPTEKAASAELLGYLGDRDRHVPILRRIASDSEMLGTVPEGLGLAGKGYVGAVVKSTAPGVQRAASFDFSGKERTVADVAFDAMLRLNEGTAGDQLKFLANEGLSSSPTRDLALQRLGRVRETVGKDFSQVANASGNREKLPQLLDLMSHSRDENVRSMAFDEAMILGADSPEFTKSVVAKALEVPGLARKALRYVKPETAIDFEPQLRRLARRRWDGESQEIADGLLRTMVFESNQSRAIELLKSDNPRGVAQGVEMIVRSQTADKRVIEPLLEAASRSDEATSRAARQALLRFNTQLVKFYAHALKSRGVVIPPQVAAVYTKQQPLR